MSQTQDAPWDFRFSNFAPAEVYDDCDLLYPTVEHAYQASKTHDLNERCAIAVMAKPGAAKRRGRLIEVRPDWDRIKIAVMASLLRQKFRPGSDYARSLLQTGSVTLCETNHWHDDYWGNCVCPEHIAKPGANWLGYTLMLIRSELSL